MTSRCLLLAALLAALPAAAQTYKCTDARGKITYTSTPCEEAGMKGGEIRDRLNSAPAQKPAKPATVTAPRAPAPETAAKDPPDKPQRRCFTVKTAKGTATRCNDDPGIDDPVPDDARSRGETRAQ